MTEPNKLQAALDSQIAAFPCQTALLACRMNEEGAAFAPADLLYAHRASERVVSASTIKLPILLAALALCDAGKLNIFAPITLPPADILPDTEVFEAENLRPAYPLWELLYWMIVESDNTATNRMIDLLGYGAINDFCARLGLTETLARRKMLDWAAIDAGKNNYTSARDQCRLYAALCGHTLLKAESRAMALDFLCRQRCMDSGLRYIPQSVPFAHKTGGLDYLQHDAGVFFAPGRRLFLGIFTWEGPSVEEDPRQKRYIGKLARTVFDAAYPDCDK